MMPFAFRICAWIRRLDSEREETTHGKQGHDSQNDLKWKSSHLEAREQTDSVPFCIMNFECARCPNAFEQLLSYLFFVVAAAGNANALFLLLPLSNPFTPGKSLPSASGFLTS